jgi:hypothetical protein
MSNIVRLRDYERKCRAEEPCTQSSDAQVIILPVIRTRPPNVVRLVPPEERPFSA